MAVELGTAFLSIMPSMKGFSRKLASEMRQDGAAAGRSFEQGFQQAAEPKVDPKVDKSSDGGSVGKGWGMAFVGAAGAALATLGAGRALSFGLEVASQNEQAAISFTTMLGSAKAANAFIRDMTAFAARTPFEMPGLQESASQLIAAGIDANKVIPIMTTLGDVTSGMGTGAEGIDRATVALQQMNAAQRITAEDLNQLRDAGIPVYDLLAAATGKSKKEIVGMASAGKLGKKELDAMMKALETGKGLEKFNGLMAKQSQSLEGMAATLSDTFGQGLAAALQPALPAIKSVMGAVTAGVGPALAVVGDGFARVIESATPLAETVGPMLGGVLATWSSLFAQIGPAAGAFMPILLSAAQQLAPVFQQLQGTVFAAIGQIVSQLLPTVGSLISTLLPALMQIGGAVGSVLNAVIPVVSQIVSTLLAALNENMPTIQAMFTTVGEVISNVAMIITTVWGAVGPVLLPLIQTVFGTLVKIIGGAFDIIGGLVKVITGVLTGDWKKAGEGLQQIIGGAWKIISGIFEGALNGIRTVFGGAVSWILDRVGEFRRSFVTIFENVVAWLTNVFRDQIAKVREWIVDPVRKAVEAVAGFLGGIPKTFSDAVSAIGKAWDGLKDKAKEPVRFVIETVINGLIGKFNEIAKAFGAPTIPDLPLPPGFHEGGWTGPGGKYTPAGVVHADEFVVSKAARAAFEKKFPGYLDHINRTGTMPGYSDGGLVTWKGKTFSSLFARNLQLAEQMSGSSFNIFQGGYRPTTSYSGTSHAKDAIDLGPITSAVIIALRRVGIAAWDRTGMGNWSPHVHAVPTPGAGFAGGSAVWQAQDYLNGGDGLGGRDNGPRVAGGGGFQLPAGLDLGFLTDPAEAAKGFFAGVLDKVDGIADSPFGKIISAVPGKVVDAAIEKVKDLISPVGYANGVRSASRGLHWVGERGRELVDFGGGESVYDARTSAALAGAGDGPMEIRGTLDLGNGLTGFVEGVVVKAARSAGKRV